MNIRKITFKPNGVPVDADNVTLSDKSSVYGIKEEISGTVILPAGTTVVRQSVGIYTIDVSNIGLVTNRQYRISWKIEYNGETYYFDKLFELETDAEIDDGIHTTRTKCKQHAPELANDMLPTRFSQYLKDSEIELENYSITITNKNYELLQRNLICHYFAMKNDGLIEKKKVDGLETGYRVGTVGTGLLRTKYGQEVQRILDNLSGTDKSVGVGVLHWN